MEKLDNKYFVTRVYWPWIDDGEYCMESPSDFAIRLSFGRILAKVFRDTKYGKFDLKQIFSQEEQYRGTANFGIFDYSHGQLYTIAFLTFEFYDDRFIAKKWHTANKTEDGKIVEELMTPKYQKRYRHAMYKRFGFKYLWHLHKLKKQEQIKKEAANNQKDTKEENLTM